MRAEVANPCWAKVTEACQFHKAEAFAILVFVGALEGREWGDFGRGVTAEAVLQLLLIGQPIVQKTLLQVPVDLLPQINKC